MRYDQKQRDPFYATEAWQRVRVAALQRDHYWCTRCGRHPANTVHHVIPRTERPDLAMELSNLQSICARCHNQLHPEKGAKNYRGPARREAPAGIRVIVIK